MSIVFDASRKVVGITADEMIQFDLVENPTAISPTAGSPVVYKDVTYVEKTTSGSKNDFDVNITNPPFGSAYYKIAPSGILQITDDHGDGLADGTVELKIGVPGHGEKRLSRDVVISGVLTWKDVTNYSSGSLAQHCLDQIDALVSGYSANHAAQEHIDGALSTFDIGSPNIVMNPSCFVAGIDFSAISVLRTDKTGSKYPLCLIGPRHVISGHVTTYAGETVVFRRPDGTYDTRTVTLAQKVVNREFTIGYLDAPVTGVTPLKIPPKGFESTYFPCLDTDIYSPAIPGLRRAIHFSDGTASPYSTSIFQVATINYDHLGVINNGVQDLSASVSAHLNAWAHTAQGGDSNGPTFLMVNGEPVLLSMQYHAITTNDFSYVTDDINDAMDISAGAASGTYAIGHADFSGFTAY